MPEPSAPRKSKSSPARDMRKRRELPVEGCARCGRNHRRVVFIPLKRTKLYFGACPTVDQPILMFIRQIGGAFWGSQADEPTSGGPER